MEVFEDFIRPKENWNFRTAERTFGRRNFLFWAPAFILGILGSPVESDRCHGVNEMISVTLWKEGQPYTYSFIH